MTPNESLIALLAAIYLSDCWYFIPHRALVFSSPLLRTWRWTRTKSWLGTRSGGGILLQVLPPLGRHVVCDFWPLAVAPDAAVSRDTAWAPLGNGQHVLVPISADSTALLRADGKCIQSGGTTIARVASNRGARLLTALLRELGAISVDARKTRIERAVVESFDCKQIEHRRDQLFESGRPLLMACNMLLVYLAAIVPLVLWQIGITRTWIALLMLLIGLQFLVLCCFVRAHRRIFVDEIGERRWLLFQMALSPPVAIRAHDALSRDAFAEFHPVAVASVLTPGLQFKLLARTELRECRFGARRRNAPSSAAPTRVWFDERVFEQAAKLVASTGVAPAELLASPTPEKGALAACPMCDTQFTLAEGVCEDCGGIPLIGSEAGNPRGA